MRVHLASDVAGLLPLVLLCMQVLLAVKRSRVGPLHCSQKELSPHSTVGPVLPSMVQASTQTQAAVAAYNKNAPAQALVIIKNAPVPQPGPGEVLVHINLRPVNPSDIFWCSFPPSFLPYLYNIRDYDIVLVANSNLVSSPAQPARRLRRFQAFQASRSARAGR